MHPNNRHIKNHNFPIFISFEQVGGGGGGLVEEKPIDASGKTAATTSYSGDIVNHYTYQLGKKVYNSQHTLTVDEEYYDELMFSFGKPSRISHGDGYVTLSRNGSVAEVYYYSDRLGSSISSSFSGTGESINFRADVNISVSTESNSVSATDHQFIIHDQGAIPGAEGRSGVLGSAKLGGTEINISQHILDRTGATSGTNAGTGKTNSGLGTLERTGSHELGHSGTLQHPTPGTLDNNLMHQTKQPNAGMVVTESQILQIEQAFKDDK